MALRKINDASDGDVDTSDGDTYGDDNLNNDSDCDDYDD